MTQVARKGDAALGLKLAGATYDQIAETLGYRDAATARTDVERAAAANVDDYSRAEHRNLAMLRYERLLRGVWTKAVNDKNAEQLPAARIAKDIVDRMVVLQGAAQPTEVIVSNPNNDQILAWLAKVGAIELPQVIEHDPFDIEDAEVVDEDPAPGE